MIRYRWMLFITVALCLTVSVGGCGDSSSSATATAGAPVGVVVPGVIPPPPGQVDPVTGVSAPSGTWLHFFDVNRDGMVNADDMAVIDAVMAGNRVFLKFSAQCDVNLDGAVDQNDRDTVEAYARGQATEAEAEAFVTTLQGHANYRSCTRAYREQIVIDGQLQFAWVATVIVNFESRAAEIQAGGIARIEPNREPWLDHPEEDGRIGDGWLLRFTFVVTDPDVGLTVGMNGYVTDGVIRRYLDHVSPPDPDWPDYVDYGPGNVHRGIAWHLTADGTAAWGVP